MSPKTQVIVNPESDQGRTGKRWKQIKEALKSFLKEFKYEFTEKPFQAVEIARDSIKSGFELIVGVGGDGTINEIANGFYEEKNLINPHSCLGIIPSGTGCDFTKSLNIPYNLKNSLKLITQTPSSLIDVGRIHFQDPQGKKKERLFLNIADFGIGGEVVRKINQKRMKHKTSSYLKALFSSYASYKNKNIRISVDDKLISSDEYMIGAFSNGRIFGKGMKIAPHAKLNDGLLDIVLVKGMKFMEFLMNSWKIYTGSHLSHPKVNFIRGKKIEVVPAKEDSVLMEMDGEQIGHLPATIEIVPQSLLVKGNI